MRAVKRSFVGVLLASFAVGGVGCGQVSGANRGDAASPAPVTLRSQRRLVYLVADAVPVTAKPDPGVAPGVAHKLHTWVKRDMRELGLEVDGDAAGYDVAVNISASVQGVGRLVRGRAAAWVTADRQLLAQIDSGEIIEAPDRLASALARELVDRLARSPRPAEYADILYGRRLRPLHDTVGRHAVGQSDQGGGPPFLDPLPWSDARRVYNRTLQGRAELAPPPEAPAPARAAATASLQEAQTLLQAGRYRDAYAAFEQAYLLGAEAEPLFGMAETLLRSGDRQDALIFYRAYLGRAQPGSPDAARATAQIGALK
jgi:tetratricopeptide (TPR) repeat protein